MTYELVYYRAMGKISEWHFGDAFADSNSIQKLLNSTSKKAYLAREFHTSLGVPDYVLLDEADYLNLNWFAKNHQNVKLSGKYAAVISYIAKNTKVEIKDIENLLHQRKSEILNYLSQLEEWGIVTVEDNTKVFYNSSFSIPEIRSVAVELKLSSWEKALWQAIRNKSQFSSSYVVMPSNKLDLLSNNADVFKSNDVSMAVFDVDSLELTPLHNFSNQMLPSNRHYLELLDSLVSNISSFHLVTR